jgi:hypothetical protein
MAPVPLNETDAQKQVRLQKEQEETKKVTLAKTRIDHFIARKLDAFQTRAEYNWARLNQYVSVSLSAIFLISIFLTLKGDFFPSIVLAFFGGMMAPLAKDVVSALSGLKLK